MMRVIFLITLLLPFLFEFGAIVEATTKNLTQSVVDLRLHNQRYEEHGVGTVTEVEMPGKIVHFGPPQIMELKFGKASSEKKPPITTAINNSSAVALVDSEKLERPKFRKYTKHSSKQRLRAVSSKNTTTASTPLATSTTPTEGQAEQNQTAVDGGQSKVPTFGTSMQLLPKQQPSTESPSGGDSNVDQKEPSATTTTETPPPHPLPIPSGTGSNRKTVHSPTHHNVEAVHEHETVTHEQSSLFQSSGPPAPAPESSFPSSLPLPPLPTHPTGPSAKKLDHSNLPNFKLIYFDARGICEPIRLLFHYAKVPFEDTRISRKQWLALKDSTVYGKVPILEIDGKPLTYCHTIARYLAKMFGLAGRNEWEQAKVDEVADFHADVAMDLQPYMYVIAGFHHGDKATLRSAIFLPGVEKNFPVYVQLLKQSGSGFFMPSGVTWVDFVVAEYMTTVKHFEPQILDKYPAISKFIRKVQTLPQIFDYISNREHQPVH